MEEQEQYAYPHEEFRGDIGEMAKRMKDAERARGRKFTNIFGIPNGGAVVAIYLRNLLLPDDDVRVIFDKRKITRDTFIVDDVVDTGNTMNRVLVGIKMRYGIAMFFCEIADGFFRSGMAERFLARIRKRYYIATLFYKEGASPRPDFFVHKKTAWVRYPCETKKSSRYDGTV